MAGKAKGTASLLFLLVVIPSACIAMYRWGHLMLAPAPPKPLVVYSTTKPAWKSSVDAAAPVKGSLEMITNEDLSGLPGSVPGAARAAHSDRTPRAGGSPRVPTAAELVAEQEAKTAGEAGGQARKGLWYPKLRPTRGWKSLFMPSVSEGASSDAFYATPPDQPAAEPVPEPQAPPVVQSAPGPAAATVSNPVAPPAAKRGYKPAPVAYSAQKAAATAAASGGPVGEAEVAAGDIPQQRRRGPPAHPDTFIGPPDRIPEPNPERAVKEGKCPKAGWWFNAYNGLCYQTQPACLGADYAKAGCKKS